MNAQHLSRREYASPDDALEDARRVVQSIGDLATEQTVIPADELRFLVGRADRLIAACITYRRDPR
jgi:hypothetical protein